ncbi:MAG: radical SAM protein [Nitrospiraceae bacterium]|nr:MAG: radical SAM protein [Nitrospiraceae bacterium]
MSNTVQTLHELGFADNEIAECLRRKELLSIELEFTKKCNLRCIYCYSDAGEPLNDELGLDEIKSVILQAKELGARKVVLLGGGEPLMYRELIEVINYTYSLGLQNILFTNGTLITKDAARFLFRKKVPVIIKCNSLRPEVQDALAGVKGVFRNISRGLGFLLEAGYPERDAMLGIQTVICRQNIGEVPSMWTWARDKGIIPYFEMLTKQGRAKENSTLDVEASEIRDAFERIEKIDREKFGIVWEPRPTVAAFSCKRHLYSCLINSQGYLQPCTGIDIAVGNVRESSLKEILESSSIINDLRNIYDRIEGACRDCEHNCECYGCRGNAYQITGNYLASDPACWRLKKGPG